MKKSIISIILVILNIQLRAQSKQEITSLIDVVAIEVDSSQSIIHNKSSKTILDYGVDVIPQLIQLFVNNERTTVYSVCQEKYLTKGEIAIILADGIERMPYFVVTGIQNCTLNFCKNNPNLIEYYLWAIQRDGVSEFKKRYEDWFENERKK